MARRIVQNYFGMARASASVILPQVVRPDRRNTGVEPSPHPGEGQSALGPAQAEKGSVTEASSCNGLNLWL